MSCWLKWLGLAAAVSMKIATVFAAAPVPSAGSKYFDSADKSLNDGASSSAEALAEKGWAAVRAAGPAAPGFLNGISDASRILAVAGRELRAEAIYIEAEALCNTSELAIVKQRVRFMHAFELIRHSRYVMAESILRPALATEDATEHKSSLYVSILQSLAFVREQEGDPDDAEALYRMTIGYPTPDLSQVVIERMTSGKQRLPSFGEARSSMASFNSNHDRFKEAEALYRAQSTQDAQTFEQRVGAMNQLADFLSWHGSKAEAIAVELQILQITEAEALKEPKWEEWVSRHRYALANLEVEAGRSEDAKAILEHVLKEAGAQHGKSSREYARALLDLFENRRYAGDYDAVADLASEALRRAQEHAESEPDELANALFRMAEIRSGQGRAEESEALRKKGIELNRKRRPEIARASEDKFEQAESLVRMGKHDDAVQVAREIADVPPDRWGGEQFNFQHLAQFLAIDDIANAAKVASIALSSAERWQVESPSLASQLTSWANFYRSALHQTGQARDLLARAERVVAACCGIGSPHMEPLLQERAWLAEQTDGEGSGIPFLEQLRNLRGSIYGENSEQVEHSTMALAAAHASAGDWPGAAKLYFKGIDISSRRSGKRGYEFVALLDSVATAFFDHGDNETALALNERALAHVSDFGRADDLKRILMQHREEIQSRR